MDRVALRSAPTKDGDVPLQLTLPDGSVREYPDGTTGLEVAEEIGPRLAKAAVAVKVGDDWYDLTRPLERPGEVIPVVADLDRHRGLGEAGADLLGDLEPGGPVGVLPDRAVGERQLQGHVSVLRRGRPQGYPVHHLRRSSCDNGRRR